MTPDRLRELEDIQNANCPCVECAGIRELVAEVRRLQGVIAQHDLCHDLHGKVNAADFAAGCAAEQRRLYGCAPDADEAARLRGRVAELEAEHG